MCLFKVYDIFHKGGVIVICESSSSAQDTSHSHPRRCFQRIVQLDLYLYGRGG